MSKYIKEWLFCESGNAYKLPEIVCVLDGETILLENKRLCRVCENDYIEIINALKERELAITELLESEDIIYE